jgi:hypothetical protein
MLAAPPSLLRDKRTARAAADPMCPAQCTREQGWQTLSAIPGHIEAIGRGRFIARLRRAVDSPRRSRAVDRRHQRAYDGAGRHGLDMHRSEPAGALVLPDPGRPGSYFDERLDRGGLVTRRLERRASGESHDPGEIGDQWQADADIDQTSQTHRRPPGE